MIDVIVPVYRGLAETQACLESVWKARCILPFRLIVINDCSPESVLTHWIEQQSQCRPMILMHNSENIGFVASVNCGMSLSDENDVILLNSDTEVAADWLDRLHQAAYASAEICTVTPFSNNATICSYPAFCKDNELPKGFSVETLDSVFSQANAGMVIDIPTAVGFCMYIKREILSKIGLFDVERFGKGYGEENDFCCRARKLGYRNVLAADVFVWHKGNVSFGEEHNERKQKCLETLEKIHPEYLPDVFRHIQTDPAREARLRADVLRWQKQNLPKILFISHDRGGGTEQHCRELADLLEGRALVFKLSAESGGLTSLTGYSIGEVAAFFFVLPKEYPVFLDVLRHIGIHRIHIHHTIRVDSSVWDIAQDLGLPMDYTAHDYYAMCPQISLTDRQDRYCGEEGETQCKQCLQKRPVVGKLSIDEWRCRYRRLLDASDRVIAPSVSVGERYKKYFSLDNVVVAAHPDSSLGWPLPIQPFMVPSGRNIRVAVLGALSAIKGADVLEAAALDARDRALPISFKLFGYAYRALAKTEKLEVHGAYGVGDLPNLLTAWQPDVVWFPSLWPETYSYTLSECFRLGLPVLVSDLGAQADRVKHRANSWILPWNLNGQEWNDKIIELRQSSCESSPVEEIPHADNGALFYPDGYLQGGRRVSVKQMELPSDDFLRLTRHRELTQHQRSRLKLLETLVSLRGAPALSWLAKRIPTTLQRRIKDRLLSG